MDFLKAQFARLQQQFSQLTASQKMLSVALVAIMVMTLGWWGRYAGQAEYEQLIEQDFAAEDLARVTASLRGRAIPYTTQGSRILVPGDRKLEVLGDLIYQQLLPKEMSNSFETIFLKNDSVFSNGDRSDRLHTEARQASIAQMIRTFPKVKNAGVLIDNTRKRSFDQQINPTATIYITLRQGEKADNRLSNAAADVVCGAVAGLKRKDVHVVIDGMSRPVSAEPGEDGGFATGNWMDSVRDAESYYSLKITEQLAFCDGVMVHVNCTPKSESSETHETKVDAKGAVSKELENETESTSSNAGGRGSGDVGVNPNTGSNQKMSVAGGDAGGGGGDSSTQERSKVKNIVEIPKSETVRKDPAGSVAVTSASVVLPRSFFIKAYKSEKHVDKDPSDVVLDPYITSQLDRCKSIVKACINLPAESIVVDAYPDLALNVEAPQQSAGGVSMIIGTHGKEIALGGLALLSLFMVSMMVRKAGPVAAVAGGASAAGIGGVGGLPLGGDGRPTTVDALLAKAGLKAAVVDEAAEVGEGGQPLEGVELDDETIRAQQVVEQVSTMVKENPDAAANLVKRWLSRT